MTTRKRARDKDGLFKGDNPETLEVNEAWVETPESPESPEEEKPSTKPAEVELKTSEKESQSPAPAASAEKVQTDVRAKLAKKTDGADIFVPSSPPQLEAEAKEVANEKGFEFNRGTSIGARLMARSRAQFPK